MAKRRTKIHIPLPEKEVLDLLLKVKPTVEMPKPGPQPRTMKYCYIGTDCPTERCRSFVAYREIECGSDVPVPEDIELTCLRCQKSFSVKPESLRRIESGIRLPAIRASK
jgi:hypothetical protein